jgi:hypothetical protein
MSNFLARAKPIAALLYERCDVFSAMLTIAALCLFTMGLTRGWKKNERAADFMLHARAWAVEKYPLEQAPTPWGGSYQESPQDNIGRTLYISGFPPAQPTQFDEADKEALLSAWEAHPIAHAELVFHFNGLPMVILSR